MVLELKYKKPSGFQETIGVLLEPELTKPQLYFQAELVDSPLIAEVFYRLHRVAALRVGRRPMTEGREGQHYTGRWRWYYDPLITVADGYVEFETFSLDMGTYAKARFEEEAFKNIEHWEPGVTNVDFSDAFIKKIRGARNALQNITVDPEGLEVASDGEEILEKKIPLPESWEEGFQNLRQILKHNRTEKALTQKAFESAISNVPFPKTFLKGYVKGEKKGWTLEGGYIAIELPLRKSRGYVQIVTTSSTLDRFDGRKNINYQQIQADKDLRSVKAYFLRVEKMDKNHWRVVGDTIPHFITRTRNRLRCDCPDHRDWGQRCKHVRAVELPEVTIIQVADGLWAVTHGETEVVVTLKLNQFSCECDEFQNHNMCLHVARVQQQLGDYQASETKQDLSPKGSNIDENLTIADISIDLSLKDAIKQIGEALFSEASEIRLGDKTFPILGKVGSKKLRHLEFVIDNIPYRAIEQNPKKNSRWARRARNGSKIVWVFRYGRYYARLADGTFTYL